MNNQQALLDFISFICSSPSPWHAAEQIAKRLLCCGFIQLDEGSSWDLQSEGRYFTVRNDASVCAFVMPRCKAKKMIILASHVDSPAIKLKPNAEYRKGNMVMFGVEVYGGPLLSSWLNRDLGIAGRVFYSTQDLQQIESTLINITDCSLMIPQLAIHLDRKVNDEGLIINKQEHLAAIAALTDDSIEEGKYLENLLQRALPQKQILAHDLFLYPMQQPQFIGPQQQMLASYRLDNLASAFACSTAIEKTENREDVLQMSIFFDSEEIGSDTRQGAASPFFATTLERILSSQQLSFEEKCCLKHHSLCLSVDAAHGMHPNHSQMHEPQHLCLLGKGIVFKLHAQQRYASDAATIAPLRALCLEHSIPLQIYLHRTDMPCGSTIGPIFATNEGIATVDLGLPLLSMHSTREIISSSDFLQLQQLLSLVLQNYS